MKQFSCSDQTRSILDKLGETFLIERMRKTYDLAYQIDFNLRDCQHFEFLESPEIDMLASRDPRLGDMFFWRTFNLLIIFHARTLAASIQELIDGIAWSIEAQNPLSLALTGRALIEHASAAYCISSDVWEIREHLHNDIWPHLDPESPPKPIDSDRTVAAHLIHYALSRRIDVTDPAIRKLVTEGVKYKDAPKYLGKLVPEKLKSRNCLSDIDKTDKGPGKDILRFSYEWLSEYCHPNSAARSFSFISHTNHENIHSFKSSDLTQPSPGFLKIFQLVGKLPLNIIDRSCCMLSNSIRDLFQSMREMPDSARIAVGDNPPRGAIKTVDDFGREIWINPSSMNDSPYNPATLPPELIKRLEDVAFHVKDIMPNALQLLASSISKDSDGHENEVQLCELAASIYRQELNDRKNCTKDQKYLLWFVCNEGPYHRSVESLLNAFPELKRLSNLQGVFNRIHKKS